MHMPVCCRDYAGTALCAAARWRHQCPPPPHPPGLPWTAFPAATPALHGCLLLPVCDWPGPEADGLTVPASERVHATGRRASGVDPCLGMAVHCMPESTFLTLSWGGLGAGQTSSLRAHLTCTTHVRKDMIKASCHCLDTAASA